MAKGHIFLRLTRPEGFSEGLGQYCMVRLPDDEKARPLACCSVKSAPHVEFLVRTKDDERDQLVRAWVNGEAEMSDPAGPGWRLDDDARPVWCVAVGSGLSAVRPVMNALSLDDARGVNLIYGAHNADYLCFADEIELWRSRGCAVHIAFSDDEARVQSHLDEVADDAVCLVVGMKEMVDDVRARLVARGLDADAVRTNF